jgi:hypothetical protein
MRGGEGKMTPIEQMTDKKQIEGYRKLTDLLDEVDAFLRERGACLCGERTFTPAGPFHVRVKITVDFQVIPYPPFE